MWCVNVWVGVGGNLVAVQASRLSTALHRLATPGHLPDNVSIGFVSPWSAFCGSSMHFSVTLILCMLSELWSGISGC